MRLERTVSWSQSKRATNCANPGFLVIEFCTRCGQTCGQAVFLTISACGGSACIAGISRDCGHSIFQLEGGATRSQTRRDTNFAIPGYSLFCHDTTASGKNQSFFCLWSFMWSKALLCRFRQSGKIPQMQASQGFAAFRLALSRIPPRHSQTRRDTNFAIPGYSIFAIIPRRGRKSKIFLSLVIYVVKAAFVPISAIGISPANVGLHSRSPTIIPPARRGCKDYLWCADRFSASLARMPFMASCS